MMSIALFHGGARFTKLVSQTGLWLLTQHLLFSLKIFQFPTFIFYLSLSHKRFDLLIFFLKNLFFFSDLVRDPIHDSVRSDPGFVNATFLLVFTPSLTLSFIPALLVGADCCSPPCSLCLLQSAWASARPWAYRKVEPRRGSRIFEMGGWIFSTSIREIREIKYYFNIWGIRKKKKEGGSEKGGWKFTHFTSPGSTPGASPFPCLWQVGISAGSLPDLVALSRLTPRQGTRVVPAFRALLSPECCFDH